MTYSVRVLPAADADVDGEAAFIARNSLQSALRFYDAVDATYRELREYPKRWPIYGPDHPRLLDVRKRAVIGFRNHLVFYRIDQK